MVKKLYIGNLAEGVTEDDLMANFSEIGKVVSLAIIRDKITGLSRGFGFVEMATEAQAQEAIQTFKERAARGEFAKHPIVPAPPRRG